ncbi:unnamed protein product [Moneuplotes crassus]|uniref:Uncharacterized protein n=1 Tax=Euplotes crassus TaxID=5936 RepID=A0AAD1YB76_EUPCR|nr:unnamed protein product [Moneuplotes crassus]
MPRMSIDPQNESSTLWFTSPDLFHSATNRLCRQKIFSEARLSFKLKEEKYDEKRARLESKISSTKPNFGNTLKKMINTDQEEVEDLQNWQHDNHILFPKVALDQEFKKKYLDPIEDQSNRGFEILLKDPIFKHSKIITDPRKLSERFNRNKKKARREEMKAAACLSSPTQSVIGSLSPQTNLACGSIGSIGSSNWNSLSDFRNIEDIDYLQISKEEVGRMTKKNVGNEVRLEFKKQKLVKELKIFSSRQENLRKKNIEYASARQNQAAKIKLCENQINVLSDMIKELAESDVPKLDETGRIWKVKEKIRGVIKHKQEDIQAKKGLILENKKVIEKIESKTQSIKAEIEEIEFAQIQHYYKVLQIGLDTRQEGLSWVLRALMMLGETVKISKFPRFLDPKAIQYLLGITQLKMTLEDIRASITEFVTKRKETLIEKEKGQFEESIFEQREQLSNADSLFDGKFAPRRSSAPSLPSGGVKTSQFFKKRNDPTNRMANLKDKNEILSLIKEKLHTMSKTTKVDQIHPDQKSTNIHGLQLDDIFHNVNIPIEGKTCFDTGMINLEINELEDKVKELKVQIHEMRDLEASRMERLFRKSANNYKHRYRVSKEIINNALGFNLLEHHVRSFNE